MKHLYPYFSNLLYSKIVLYSVCFLFLFGTHPKIIAQAKLKPVAEKIVKLKKTEIFNSVSLFSSSIDNTSTKRAVVAAVAKDAWLLNLDVVALEKAMLNNPQKIQLQIPVSATRTFSIILVQEQVLTDDFLVTLSAGTKEKNKANYKPGIYYRGIIDGDVNSLAAISLFNGEVMGVISNNEGNYVLGKLNNAQKQTAYVVYNDQNMAVLNPITCNLSDEEIPNSIIPNGPSSGAALEQMLVCNPIVRVYFECAYDMYQSFGNNSTSVTNYVTGLYNVVTALYANEQITTQISEIYIWTTTDPYSAYPNNLSSDALNAFNAQIGNTFNGDLAHLLSTNSGNYGGLASVNALCASSYRIAYSNIYTTYANLPTYSWTIEVVTHEIGHNLGSPHTQSCSWPGGAIDNCYAVEGTCSPGPAPVGGGTIMSYCHLTSTGINFNNGFGLLPGNLIRSRVAAAACLQGAEQAVNFTASATNLSVIFTSTNTNVFNYVWNFGDGFTSTQANPTHVYTASGTYNVCLTITDDCGTRQACQNIIVTGNPFCTGTTTLTNCIGTFTDGSGSNDYQNAQNCSWLIQPAGATAITLNFTNFVTEAGFDYVYVYDGTNNIAPLLGSFSGNAIPPAVTSSGGALFVEFATDALVTFAGWSANYACSYCSGTTTFNTCSGTFSDGSGSANYNDNQLCNWLIQPAGATSVTLNFTDFNLEYGYDFVRIYDGIDNSGILLANFSGYAIPPSVTANSGAMYIEFSTDISITYNGWTATYSCSYVPNFDCPALPANFGDACNDGNPNTINDVIQSNCTCAGTLIPAGGGTCAEAPQTNTYWAGNTDMIQISGDGYYKRFHSFIDFNNDGLDDMLIAEAKGYDPESTAAPQGGSMYLYRNTGTGFVFENQITGLPDFINSYTKLKDKDRYFTDFNGDGIKDLLLNCANYYSCQNNTIAVLQGFAAAPWFGNPIALTLNYPFCVQAFALDNDNDGDKDIYIDNMPGSCLMTDRLYRNDGNFNFTLATNAILTMRDYNCEVVNYDGGGDDLICNKSGWADNYWGNYYWRSNNTGGFMASIANYASSPFDPGASCSAGSPANPGIKPDPTSWFVLRNDPNINFVFIAQNDGSSGAILYIAKWNGVNNFTFTTVGAEANCTLVGVEDWNEDGLEDLFYTIPNVSNYDLKVMVNTGTGSFYPADMFICNMPYPVFGIIDLDNATNQLQVAAQSTTADTLVIWSAFLCDNPYTANLTGSANVCSGNPVTLTFNFTGGTPPYTVNWTNGTLNNVNNGQTIVVSPTTTTTYTISSATDAAGCPATIGSSATVTITAQDQASISNASLCQSAGSYTPTVTGTQGGTFSAAPGGMSINATTGIINPAASFPNTYTVTYNTAPTGSLCPTTTTFQVVILTTPATPGAMTGPTTLCPGATANYSVSAVAGATSYSWTVPAGATINSGQGTTAVNVTWGASGGSICVRAQNTCGLSGPRCATVTGCNDICTDAILLSCGGTPATGTTIGANIDAVGTCNTALDTAPGVWYAIEGTGTDITVSTCSGSNFDTKIGVFTGSCGALSCVSDNDDACNPQSSVTFNSSIGNTYYILVTGFGTSAGVYTLTYSCSLFDCPALPANFGDSCNDGNPNTINDVIQPDCTCAGTPTGLTPCQQSLQADSLQLVAFYNATNGANWTNNSGWLTGPVNTWFGVTLTNDDCNVEQILLYYNDLSGNLIDLNLPGLHTLWLFSNQLTGSIPDFSNLPNLTYLYLTSNELTGNIPDFGNLPNLQYLLLDYNQLTGSIPDFSNVPNLSDLYLNNNQLSGSIPNFGNLPDLQNLFIGFNQLTGSIPDFSNVPDLQELYLNGNQLTFAGLPQHIGQYNTFLYAPQATIPTYLTGSVLSVSAGGYTQTGSTCNQFTYNWYLEGNPTPVYTTTCDSTYTPTQSGSYYCQITNSVATDLTLTSQMQSVVHYDCPTLQLNFGDACDDGNPDTGNDMVLGDCTCQGIPINNCSTFQLTFLIFEAQCSALNGGIDISLTGGQLPYSYIWSNGATTEDLSSLAPGIYTVTATDSAGCTIIEQMIVNSISIGGPAISGITTVPTQCGSSEGSVDLTVTGGLMPYSYLWSNGATTEDVSNLAFGNYTVTITDANGCTANTIATVSITDPPLLQTDGDVANCAGALTFLGAQVLGGTGDETFIWSDGQTGSIIAVSPITTTIYIVTVTDAGGCTASAQSTVFVLPTPAVNAGSDQTICNGSSATLQATGGLLYMWNTGATASSITVSPSATTTFTVTVTDSYGCTGTDNVTVNTSGSGITLSAETIDAVCDNANGSIDLTVVNGISPFSYVWSNGEVTEDLVNLPPGTYTVTVTDAIGCNQTAGIVISSISVLEVAVSTNNATCGDENGSINLTPVNGTPPYFYVWSNDEVTEDLTSLPPGTYTVTVTDSGGCTTSAAVILEGDEISAQTVVTYNCEGASGEITLEVSGGLSPYSYLWSDESTGSVFQFTQSGNYFVTITDVTGCTTIANAVIDAGIQPTAEAIAMASTCGLNNGSISLNVNGFTSPAYLWSNGAQTQNISGLAPGSYSVTVTSLAGCTATASATISSSIAPIAIAVGGTTSCGLDNGSVILATTGFSAPTYTWSNGAATDNLTNVAAGIYSVTVTDSDCSATASALVLPSSAIIIDDVTLIPPSCNNANGSIDISVSGTGSYIYAWSNGASTEDISNLETGTYTVAIANSDETCMIFETFNLIGTTSPDVSIISVNDANCSNADGSIAISVTGGQPPYGFTWSNGATTQNLNNIPSGIYEVTVSDMNDCFGLADNLQVQNNTSFTASANVGASICGADGFIEIIPAPASSLYNYTWSHDNSLNGSVASGLASGFYSITINDGNCTEVLNTVVDGVDSPLEIYVNAINNPDCSNSNGSIQLIIVGGSTGYVYTWSHNSSLNSANATGLSAGTYFVTVTDGFGCSASDSFTLTTPTIVLPPINTISTCAGTSATIVAPFGFSSYAWSNGAIGQTNTVSPLISTTYILTVTDAGGCTATGNALVTINPNPNPAISGALGLCAGGNTVLNVGGGYSAYNWSNGGVGQSLTVITSGTYQVTVTDNNGCTATASAVVSNYDSPMVSATATGASCGLNNGTISLTVTGGGFPYEYLWSNEMEVANLEGLSSGTYTVTVYDVYGCATVSTIEVGEVGIDILVQTNNPTCIGSANGSILLTPSGGSGSYGYNWIPAISSTSTAENLGAGTFFVSVYDLNNPSCTISQIVTINNNAIFTANITGSTNCDGNLLDLEVSTEGAFTYLWSNGVTTEDIANVSEGFYTVTVTSPDGLCTVTASSEIDATEGVDISIAGDLFICGSGSIGSLDAGSGYPVYQWSTSEETQVIAITEPGNYSVTVSNAAGCTGSASVIVTGAPDITASISGNTTVCSGSSTTLTATGGDTYVWSNGATSAAITATEAGSYTVTVSNAAGCTGSASVTVTGAPDITASISGATAICSGSSTTLTATGGDTYVWSSGAASATITATEAGSYSVTVSNASGCTGSASVTVTGAPDITASISGATAFCSGSSTTLTATGGDTYLWSNGAASAAITATEAGSYSVTVSDAEGCTGSASVTVTGAPDITAFISGNTAFCSGSSTTLTATGGDTYVWSNGAASAAITATEASSYSVTVSDAAGCTGSASVIVTGAPDITASISGATAICSGSSTTLTATGGDTYVWSNGAASAAITATEAGSYSVTVSDAAGCTGSASVIVTGAPDITAFISGNTAICSGSSTTLTATGGDTYLWSNGAASAAITATEAGSYSVTVSDAAGCTGSASVIVTGAPDITASISGATAICSGSSTTLTATGGDTYVWSNGAASAAITATEAGSYSVTVSDAAGCTGSASVTVTGAPDITASISGATAICSGSSTTLTATGGDTYLWSNGATSATITATEAGNYSVTVSNAAGCTGSASVIVTGAPDITASISGATAICSGSSTTLTATGGDTYLWSNGATSAAITATEAGSYSVTVSNASGCTGSANIAVFVEGTLPISLATPPPLCGDEIIYLPDLLLNGTQNNGTWLGEGVIGSQLFANLLGPGSHTIIYQLSNILCPVTSTDSVEIVMNPPIQPYNHSCYPEGAGYVVSFSVMGGSSPYTIGGELINVGEVYTSNILTTPNYTITVTDSNDCDFQLSGTNVVCDALCAIPTTGIIAPNSENGFDIFLETSPPPIADLPYLFSIDGVNWVPEDIFSNLPEGEYYVYVYHSCGIFIIGTFTSTVVDVASVSATLPINIYPNPSDGIFTIESATNLPASVKLYNTLGQLVWEISTNLMVPLQLDLSNFSAGMYFVSIETSSKTVVRKILKK